MNNKTTDQPRKEKDRAGKRKNRQLPGIKITESCSLNGGIIDTIVRKLLREKAQ
jgi:hypothetical protein